MKILIYSEGRVGSHSLGNWLSNELEIYFFIENVIFNMETNKDYVHKVYFFEPEHANINFDRYDKVIVLYRKNTFEQAISNIYATIFKKYHHNTLDDLDGYYEINKEFCDNNYLKITRLIDEHNYSKSILLKMENCLLISYEEIFIDNTGQKILEDYIGFKAKTSIMDSRLKLRRKTEEVDLYLKKLIFNEKGII
jgi:hypothetical protein